MPTNRTLDLGTISSGTLRPEDIFPELEYCARQLSMSRKDRCTTQRLAREFEALPEDNEDTADEILTEMYQLLENYIPDYCYLGSHPGDGADIGVWPSEELFSDRSPGGFDGCIATSRADAAPDHSHALEVNDHGNATLYRRAGRRWLEVWSIV